MREIEGVVQPFYVVIGPEVNIEARLEFELDYYDIVVQHISHYGMGEPSLNNSISCEIIISMQVRIIIFLAGMNANMGTFEINLREGSTNFSKLVFRYTSKKNVLEHGTWCGSNFTYPVGWGCRIHRLLICRGVRTPTTSVLDMALNNLMMWFQYCWSFGNMGVPIYCHRSQVYSGPEW